MKNKTNKKKRVCSTIQRQFRSKSESIKPKPLTIDSH